LLSYFAYAAHIPKTFTENHTSKHTQPSFFHNDKRFENFFENWNILTGEGIMKILPDFYVKI